MAVKLMGDVRTTGAEPLPPPCDPPSQNLTWNSFYLIPLSVGTFSSRNATIICPPLPSCHLTYFHLHQPHAHLSIHGQYPATAQLWKIAQAQAPVPTQWCATFAEILTTIMPVMTQLSELIAAEADPLALAKAGKSAPL